MRKTILQVKSGSHMYGLNTSESDIDFISIFLPTAKDVLGLKVLDHIDDSSNKSNTKNTKDDIDDWKYAVRHFLKLLLNNNPNIVELLYIKEAIVLEPEFQFLIDNRDRIVSKRIFNSFTGYAISQKNKLVGKSERYHSLNEGIKKIETDKYFAPVLGTHYKITEDDSHSLNVWIKHYKGFKNNIEHFHKGMDLDMIYSKLKYESDAYGWRVKTPSFTKTGIDLKFAYHLVRIIGEAEMLLRDGEIHYPISGQLRSDIINVREGKLTLEEILDIYEFYNNRCEYFLKTTSLIDNPDRGFINDWLVDTMTKHIKEN